MKRLTAVMMLWVSFGCAGRWSEVKDVATKDLQCAADDISVSEPTQEQRKVLALVAAPVQVVARGCGKRLVYAHMCQASDETRCAWYSSKGLRHELLVKRAAFDMRCQGDKLAFASLDPAAIGVTGCGQRVTYVWSCPHSPELFSGDCSWVANVESRKAVQ